MFTTITLLTLAILGGGVYLLTRYLDRRQEAEDEASRIKMQRSIAALDYRSFTKREHEDVHPRSRPPRLAVRQDPRDVRHRR